MTQVEVTLLKDWGKRRAGWRVFVEQSEARELIDSGRAVLFHPPDQPAPEPPPAPPVLDPLPASESPPDGDDDE